ncbi:hypothetical protein DVA86_08110 [Streptomyces armeniacus]|uniref:DUF5304 domain-containing protein n=1 Tax=Streptomyces armeniacus TaxID=83291 RepID=A0A345XLU8_9ACTN|nr:DUF5304 domain-containing protein [Streptomyces armeniacus]AXK32614.1 hypothetical protein DVA86_08110 [Streptomyces armeniacus]
MSDAAAERPAAEPDADADAWAAACEEDLAAEKARRRAEYGPQPVSAAEELRRLADAVADKVGQLGKPLAGPAGQAAAQGVAQQLFQQARAVVEPVVERNPQVFDHLATAGSELLAAYRSAVQGEERRWSATVRPEDAQRPADLTKDGTDGTKDGTDSGGDRGSGEGRRDGDDPGGPQQIDLD